MSEWLSLRQDWPWESVSGLQAADVLLVEDGNHGEYRPRPHEFVDRGTAFLRAADLADGMPMFESAGHINDQALARIRKGIGAAGDILFSHKGTVGKVARAPNNAPPYVCSPQTTFWRVLDENVLDARFLYCYMRSPEFIRQWTARKGDTDMADYVSLTAQRALLVPLPPLPVQQKIASIVSPYDDLIKNNQRRIKLLEEMAQRIFREWFEHFRYPGSEDVSIVESDLGLIPTGWPVTTASSVITIDPKVEIPKEDPVPFIPMAALSETTSHISATEPRLNPGGSRFLNFDTLFARITPCLENGKTAYVQNLRDGQAAAGSTEFIVLRSRNLTPEYVYLLARSDSFRAHAIKSLSGASGRQRVRREAFDSYRLALPPPDILNAFQSLVRPMLRTSHLLFLENGTLRSSRDLLLPRLISGEIDLDKLDIPMAETAA